MTVWMCSGQGSQKPTMGADFLASAEFAQIKETFDCASQVLGVDVAALATAGTQEQVNDAFNAQALTVALSVGIGRELQKRGKQAEAYVGFSLGQVSALALSGSLSVEDTFRLLKVRAEAMAACCKEHPGAMYALLGATHEDAEALCAECAGDEVLAAANFNCPGQVVISGQTQAIERAEAAWKAAGKRGSRLATAGGFHTPLMAPAAAEVAAFAKTLTFASLMCPSSATPMHPR